MQNLSYFFKDNNKKGEGYWEKIARNLLENFRNWLGWAKYIKQHTDVLPVNTFEHFILNIPVTWYT